MRLDSSDQANADTAAAAPPRSMLSRVCQILACFRYGDNILTLAELTRRTGLPKPTVHRVARSMAENRLLERTDGGFRLGLHLFELGGLVPHWRILREAALPFMCDLYQATHQTIHLGIMRDFEVLYLEKIRGHRDIVSVSHVGGRLPVHCSGIGKAMLAFSTPELVDQTLAGSLEALTPHTITDREVLRAELRDIVAEEVAYDREEAMVGLHCVAAPILDRRQNAVAAISVSLPIDSCDIRATAIAVRAVAQRLSLTLPSSAYL
ncbi:MAG: IclR family transcriptional regulator [Acidimicrobiaceae bacterium]|nr:IclR family transcriptional regulator [Acidimicrobiaceae bacterium]